MWVVVTTSKYQGVNVSGIYRVSHYDEYNDRYMIEVGDGWEEKIDGIDAEPIGIESDRIESQEDLPRSRKTAADRCREELSQLEKRFVVHMEKPQR